MGSEHYSHRLLHVAGTAIKGDQINNIFVWINFINYFKINVHPNHLNLEFCDSICITSKNSLLLLTLDLNETKVLVINLCYHIGLCVML